MTKITDYTKAIEQAIEQFEYGQSPAELYEPIKYLLKIGGKRLRPALTLLAYELFEENYQPAIQAALAIEVFHNFTLMHDDIMDEAPLRRGQATVHEKWNRDVAILSGDVMLVAAYDLLIDAAPAAALPAILKRFSRTAAEVCEGQQLDMNFANQVVVREEEYIEMIKLKTSVLLGFALELGARMAGKPEETIQQLYDIGVNLGIGFQLKDDILDVYGDPEKFGKQVGGDIIENKKTWLMLKALELSGSDTELITWINKTAYEPMEKVAAVMTIFDRYGIKEKAEIAMTSYFDKAFASIESLDIKEERKNVLRDFGKWLYGRDR